MVTAVTTLGRNGLADWVIQRVSAIVLAAYTLFLVIYIVSTPDLQYEQWQQLFSQTWMRVFSLLAIISVVAHAWVGLWTIVTDYITEGMLGPKALALRLLALGIYALAMAFFLVWGIEILWGFN